MDLRILLRRPEMRSWALRESRRRISLRRSDGYCDTVLVSYPRSGNHKVRHILETCTGRPTLGAGDSERIVPPNWLIDAPLSLRYPEWPIADHRPIALKRHDLHDGSDFGRMILLVRDPVDAITRQTISLSDEEFEGQVGAEVDRWLSLLHAYAKWPEDSRLLIGFDDVRQGDPATIAGLLAFVGVEDPDEVAARYLDADEGESYAGLIDEALSRDEIGHMYRERFPLRATRIDALVGADPILAAPFESLLGIARRRGLS